MVLVEEALQSQLPVIMIDLEGDLPHLLLAFPTLEARDFTSWLETLGPADSLDNVRRTSR
jgi:hypothetical protein